MLLDSLSQLLINNKNIIITLLILATFCVITYIYYRNYIIITTEEVEYVKKNELTNIVNDLAKSKTELKNLNSKINQMITSSKYGDIVYNSNQLPFTYHSLSKTPFCNIFDDVGINNVLINNDIRSTNQCNDDLMDDTNLGKVEEVEEVEEIDENVDKLNNVDEIDKNEINPDEINADHISVSSEDLMFDEKSNIKLSDKNMELSNNNDLNISDHSIGDNNIKKKITLKKKNNNDIDNNE